jgi:hypothetical protein
MVDCGVLLGTPDAAGWMQRIVADIAETTEGRIDLLVVTHEHWDHLSGFLDAEDGLKKLTIGQVWMSWAENPEDAQAQTLEKDRALAIAALRVAEARLGLDGAAEAGPLSELMGFFGSRGRSTRDALNAARNLAPNKTPRYVEPGSTLPLEGTSARAHVLGPPRDETLLRRSNPRKDEVYGFAPGMSLMQTFELMGVRVDDAKPKGVDEDDRKAAEEPRLLSADAAPDGPFAPRWGIPLQMAKSQPFFARALDAPEQSWRRIDLAWLDGALDLALRLDRDTNNSSLALAIELDGGDVLLLAADAQVGNWLSWQDLTFEDTTGPELLARTVVYKVGHHGSHNATLRAKGLEQMTGLKTALVPVDAQIARSRNWTRIPLPDLLEALEKTAKDAVLRSDAPKPERAQYVVETPLHFDVFV